MISFTNVTKRYGRTIALDRVGFEIGAGELAFLVGPSGAGKSTVLKLMTRELVADAGQVAVGGVDVGRLAGRKLPQLRAAVAHIPQEFRLLDDRDVNGNLAYSLAVAGWRRREARRRADEALEVVGLDGKGDRRPAELSGGERQRVAIARAVASGANVIVADEPTGNLDPRTSVGIVRTFADVAEAGTTVLMSTHDATIVDAMRRRVIELDHGQLIRAEIGGRYRGNPNL